MSDSCAPLPLLSFCLPSSVVCRSRPGQSALLPPHASDASSASRTGAGMPIGRATESGGGTRTRSAAGTVPHPISSCARVLIGCCCRCRLLLPPAWSLLLSSLAVPPLRSFVCLSAKLRVRGGEDVHRHVDRADPGQPGLRAEEGRRLDVGHRRGRAQTAPGGQQAVQVCRSDQHTQTRGAGAGAHGPSKPSETSSTIPAVEAETGMGLPAVGRTGGIGRTSVESRC